MCWVCAVCKALSPVDSTKYRDKLLFGNHSIVGNKQEECPKLISEGHEIVKERLILTKGV